MAKGYRIIIVDEKNTVRGGVEVGTKKALNEITNNLKKKGFKVQAA